jgi:transcriptional regulator with XRE-family HTH domain
LHLSTALGSRIKEVRGQLNQEEFSQLLGVNRNTLRAYERGVHQPNAEFLALLSSKFSLSPAWILLGEGPRHKDGQPEAPLPSMLPGQPPKRLSEAEELRIEIRELRNENRELHMENRALLKENGDLRVALARLEPRGDPNEGLIDGQAGEAARKSA